MMPIRLLLLICLTGHVFAKEPPDVDCLVVHLEYVHCSWNKQGTPEVNYTFTSWLMGYAAFYDQLPNNPAAAIKFHSDTVSECTTYLSENSMNVGCIRPYEDRIKRFYTFYTVLAHGNNTLKKEHDLKSKVKLNPPTNLTVKMGSDSNLWFYWNQTTSCVESEIRYRTKNKNWDNNRIYSGVQSYCINLPSSSSRYELQVRSKLEKTCGDSLFWSDWSEPVVWGSNNSTDTNQMNASMSVWTPVFYVLGALTLILLVMMLLHHERLRIILIPVVPKPSISHDIQDLLQLSKGLKESFKANYNERACPVREYCHVSQSDSKSSDSSTSSVTTDQTDCSVLIPAHEPDLSSPCSSSTSSGLVISEEEE